MDGLNKRALRPGSPVAIRWSASESYDCTFVRWEPMRRGCGSKNTNKIEVGAIVSSNWLFTIGGKQSSLDKGLKFGQHRVRPYHDLYDDYKDANANRRPIQRPPLDYVRRRNRLRKRVETTILPHINPVAIIEQRFNQIV